jgi:hypothetical protein
MLLRRITSVFFSLLLCCTWAMNADCRCSPTGVLRDMSCCKQRVTQEHSCCKRPPSMLQARIGTAACSCSVIPQDRLQTSHTLKLSSDPAVSLASFSRGHDNEQHLLIRTRAHAPPNLCFRPAEKIYLVHRALLI